MTDRIWPCVELQWEWLGGTPSIRRAAVVGDGLPARRLAEALTRGGFEVEHSARTDLSHHDLVCFAMPANDLPRAMARYGEHVPERAGILLRSKGLVPPLGNLPSAYVAERTAAHAIATLDGPLAPNAKLTIAGADEAFVAQLQTAFTAAGSDVARTTDLTGAHEPTRTWRTRAA